MKSNHHIPPVKPGLIGTLVRTNIGQPFIGQIRSEFCDSSGQLHYVVEATTPEYLGLLHIIPYGHLDLDSEETPNGTLLTPVEHNAISATNEPLTPRELEVLECLRAGKPNRTIARDLGMQESTVKVHVRHIMKKVGATNRTEVALRAQADQKKGGGIPPQLFEQIKL